METFSKAVRRFSKVVNSPVETGASPVPISSLAILDFSSLVNKSKASAPDRVSMRGDSSCGFMILVLPDSRVPTANS